MNRIPQTKIINPDNLFVGIYPGGMVFADRSQKEHGDYKRLAFLPWNTLKIQWYIPTDGNNKTYPTRIQWVKLIWAHVRPILAMKGQSYSIDASGHSVQLGGAS